MSNWQHTAGDGDDSFCSHLPHGNVEEPWPGLWHIFVTQGTFPESREAMQRLGCFLCRHMEVHATSQSVIAHLAGYS
jgi:hypothetical protein